MQMQLTKRRTLENFLSFFFYAGLNLLLVLIIGYLTLDVNANLNSKIAAVLLSVFMNLFIVFKFQHLTDTERVFKFGTGYFLYFISTIFIVGLSTAWVSWLLPALFVSLAVLFYGKFLLDSTSINR